MTSGLLNSDPLDGGHQISVTQDAPQQEPVQQTRPTHNAPKQTPAKSVGDTDTTIHSSVIHQLAKCWFTLFPQLELTGFCRGLIYQSALIDARQENWCIQVLRSQQAYFSEDYQTQLLQAVQRHVPEVALIAYEYTDTVSPYSIIEIQKRYDAACMDRAHKQFSAHKLARTIDQYTGTTILPCAVTLHTHFVPEDGIDFITPH